MTAVTLLTEQCLHFKLHRSVSMTVPKIGSCFRSSTVLIPNLAKYKKEVIFIAAAPFPQARSVPAEYAETFHCKHMHLYKYLHLSIHMHLYKYMHLSIHMHLHKYMHLSIHMHLRRHMHLSKHMLLSVHMLLSKHSISHRYNENNRHFPAQTKSRKKLRCFPSRPSSCFFLCSGAFYYAAALRLTIQHCIDF